MHSTTQNDFPAMENNEENDRDREENSQLAHRGKNGLFKPQTRGPFLPIHPATQKTNFGHGEMKKRQQIVKERAQQASAA